MATRPPASRELSFDDPRTTLWVKAPEFQGYLLKKGFRWTRQWKRRWVVLQNREITYYDKKPPDDELARQLVEPRGSATLQRDLKVSPKSLVHSLKDRPLDFVLYPGGGELPWELRAETVKDREAWLQVFNHCVHVASWLQTFQMGGLLGVGAAAVVREVRARETNEKFALKIVTIHDPRMRTIAVQEVQVLQRVTENICHRNLVTIKKVYESNDKLLIGMPLCSGGELYERVAALKRFTEIDAACALYRVIDAIRALHRADPPILHLDIKPENLLYENEKDDAELLVTDFGLARVYEGAETTSNWHKRPPARTENGKTERMVGTVGYMAPEVITHRFYSPAADIFSAGVVLYTLLVGYPPFGGRTDREVLENTAAGRYAMKPERGWSEVSQEAQELVRRLLEKDPSKRITSDEALANQWLLQGKPGNNLSAQLESLSLKSAALSGGGPASPTRSELPVLRQSQDNLRNFNEQRSTLRLSRAAEFVLTATPAKEGEDAPLAQMIPADYDMNSGSSVINLQNPALRKKLERAFWLLSPFNQGKLSQSRFELLARVVKASHWPQKPLFEFFDRDGDGLVSIDDFFEGQAQVRIRGTDFLFLVFESYLATIKSSTQDTENSSNDPKKKATPSKFGTVAEGNENDLSEQDRKPNTAVDAGDKLFDSPLGRMRSPSKTKNSLQNNGRDVVQLKHVRAMFEARHVPGGNEFADAVFKAALQATLKPDKTQATTPVKGSAAEAPVSPSEEEWQQRMGDLLPHNLSVGNATSAPVPAVAAEKGKGKAPPSPAAGTSSGDVDIENGGLLFPQFRRAVAVLPVLVDVMLAESKNQAISVLATANKKENGATPIVDLIEEERSSKDLAKT